MCLGRASLSHFKMYTTWKTIRAFQPEPEWMLCNKYVCAWKNINFNICICENCKIELFKVSALVVWQLCRYYTYICDWYLYILCVCLSVVCRYVELVWSFFSPLHLCIMPYAFWLLAIITDSRNFLSLSLAHTLAHIIPQQNTKNKIPSIGATHIHNPTASG